MPEPAVDVSKIMSSPPPPPAYPSTYQPHRNSLSFDPNTPPAPPPKPSTQEVSRRGTPAGSQPLPAPPLPSQEASGTYGANSELHQSPRQDQLRDVAHAQQIQDPGERWLPKILEDKRFVTVPVTSQSISSQMCTANKIWLMS